VTPGLQPDVREKLARVGAAAPGLRLLVLYGSRARGDAHAGSDWDFAYEAEAPFDPDGLLASLADLLEADRIDLTTLDGASALLRHRVARDGVAVFERTSGVFERFRLDAIHTWCDLAPVLEPLYAKVLETLPR
jgi:predicted nucleotidyltransferase